MPSLPNRNSNNDNNKPKVYTRENLGYVDGYAQYTRKSGAHWGPGIQEKKKIEKTGADADKRGGSRLNWMFDKQSNLFKKVLLGYDNTKISKSDNYEDPTYLIFDIQIDTDHSPLFSKFENDISALNFLKNYSDSIPELSERLNIRSNDPTDMVSEFQNQFLKLFQTTTPNSTDYPNNGSKQHYIESVSGLDLLNKKIINYPDDFITFTVSEDITLLLQYITELYNNLTFSYDTQRQLIPDNLLRFNLKIILSDFRNMKLETNKIKSLNPKSQIDVLETYEDMVNTHKSKMIYVLHDCQLNFFESKSFGDGITRGGFGSSKPNEISKNNFKINFKSVSRIMAPMFIDNSIIIDLREREKLEKQTYSTIYEHLDIGDDVIIMKDGTKKRKFMDKVKGAIKNELTEVRNIIVNQLKQEVGDLASRVNDWVVEKTGMSVVKLNVYQDTPGQKLGKINVKITNYIDKKVGDFLGNNDKEQESLKEKTGNIYNQTDSRRTSNPTLDKNDVYDNLNEINGVHYPSYNTKYPEGDVHPDGQYNNKTPNSDFGFITDVHENGQYNEKYPEGDVHDDSKYNQKYPDGSVQPKGNYNDKKPNDNDIIVKGTPIYKYPKGNVYKK